MRNIIISVLAVWGGLCGASWAGITPFIVEDSNKAQWYPDVSGTLVVWEEYLNGIGSIRGKDLATGEMFLIDEPTAANPITNGSIVAWVDARDGVYHLYAQDIAGGPQWRVGSLPGWQGNAAISEDYIVWNGGGTYAVDLKTREEFRVPEGTGPIRFAFPDVSGNIIVGDTSLLYASVYGYDVTTERVFMIADGAGKVGAMDAAISGNIVVWVDAAHSGVWACDLDSNAQFPIDVGDYGHNYADIDGRYVVWVDGRNGKTEMDIWGHDLLTGETFPIYEGPLAQVYPRISGNLVVWEEWPLDGSHPRIWAAYIPEPASVVLLGLGGALLAARRRRRDSTLAPARP